MTNLELLHLLKAEAAALPAAVTAPKLPDNKPESRMAEPCRYLAGRVAAYNRQTLSEIINRDSVGDIADIDQKALADFTLLLTKYMADHAPGQEALLSYVRLTATYLVFIAGKPLHPPGLTFADGQSLVARDGLFYCPLKNSQLAGEPTLCQYCVSRDRSELAGGQ